MTHRTYRKVGYCGVLMPDCRRRPVSLAPARPTAYNVVCVFINVLDLDIVLGRKVCTIYVQYSQPSNHNTSQTKTHHTTYIFGLQLIYL